MPVIPQKELRNNVSEILRRAEAGERFTVTVAGRPVATLGPTRKRQWVDPDALAAIWRTAPPRSLGEDLRDFPAEVVDPLSR
jgi:prevent-host-death family protein